jgi:hypothetical protein
MWAVCGGAGDLKSFTFENALLIGHFLSRTCSSSETYHLVFSVFNHALEKTSSSRQPISWARCLEDVQLEGALRDHFSFSGSKHHSDPTPRLLVFSSFRHA